MTDFPFGTSERKEAMRDFDEILTKLQDEIETRVLEQEVSHELKSILHTLQKKVIAFLFLTTFFYLTTQTSHTQYVNTGTFCAALENF